MCNVDYTRRKIIKSGVAAGMVTTAILSSGCSNGDVVDRKLTFSTLTEGLIEAEKLVSIGAQPTESEFTLPQTLIHCAQSIEYSLAGYPQMKSGLFQNTVGSAAFRVFVWRKRMSHNISEEIPGAEPLSTEVNAADALARLTMAIEQFEASADLLLPHFAYGDLNKDEYALAHAMHLANHFSTVAV